jgi:hypothetical protein
MQIGGVGKYRVPHDTLLLRLAFSFLIATHKE